MANRKQAARRRSGRPGRRATGGLLSCFPAILAFLLLAPAAEAHIEQFYGHWENPATDASGFRYVLVSPAGGNRVSLKLYGDCHPGLCNWGTVTARPVLETARPGDVTEIRAAVHFGFAARTFRLRAAADGSLGFAVYFQYTERTGKPDLYLRGRLRPTDWAGPVGKGSWETPQGRNAGWGGGPLGGRLTEPRETCTRFDPSAARLVRTPNGWKAVAEGTTLFRTRWDAAKARLALGTIRRYRFNAKCRSGTVTFWQRNGAFAHEAPAGAFCARFGATTAHLARIGEAWHVVDGTTDIYGFGRSRDDAFALLAMIRRHRLTRKCVLAWPDPVMVYWLSR